MPTQIEETRWTIRKLKLWRFFIMIFDFLFMSMLIVGVMYVDKCRGNPLIPKWLIVMGAVWLVRVSFLLQEFVTDRYNKRLAEQMGNEPARTTINIALIVVFAFLIAWQILGTIWIFKTAASYDVDAANYCHKELFIYSKVMVSIVYAFFGLLLICLCKPLGICFVSVFACLRL